MKYMTVSDLREKYLSFFESKDHFRLESSSLIPDGDKSLLLINSGMAPLKKYFTGEVTPPSKRVTTCQKCIRVIDIEQVGKTSRHATFFEMLGNFSFNDYFKKEATAWAWEFFTKELEIPVEKLWVSVYTEDDETADIWINHVGVDKNRIVRLGKADNFWEHGVGPCGPCSEIYVDRGAESGCGCDACAVGCECDRFVEVWNLVFTQFNNDGNGNYTPLKFKNIDTGMGMERLACMMQNVNNIFEIDTFQAILQHICKIANVKYNNNPQTDSSLQIIADHIRSSVFMVSDGVITSNEGRGYVLRRLLRRAARHGKLLGINGLFLNKLVATVVDSYGSAYPQIIEKSDFIFKLITIEEENFAKTIDQGISLLNNLIANHKTNPITGNDAFMLYDTYGFPFDLTKDILEENNIEINEQEFLDKMKEQVERARSARKGAGAEAWANGENLLNNINPTKFVGYDNLETNCKILAIIQDGELISTLDNNQAATIILDTSPFYAESGGQCGDKGYITSTGANFTVNNTKKDKTAIFTHTGSLEQGSISVGDDITAGVNKSFRSDVRRNHTAAHLLQYCARKVLGNHVEQAGQAVSDDVLRFDFTHFSAITNDEINEIEKQVNDIIFDALQVDINEMSIQDAKNLGATALFGEKYGNIVRVVNVGGKSIELCGGTHVTNTAEIGMFKIISESSVASGVRRIEAVTGKNILSRLGYYENILTDVVQNFKISNINDLANKSLSIANSIKEKDKQIEQLNNQLSVIKFESILKNWKEISDIKLITASVNDISADSLKNICDKIKTEQPDFVAVFASVSKLEGKITFSCAVGSAAVKRGLHAGNILKHIAPIAGGSGGGRPDLAMAGGKDLAKVTDALNAVEPFINDIIK